MNDVLACVAAVGIFFGAIALRGIFGYLKNKQISIEDIKFDWKKFLSGSIRPILITLAVGSLAGLILGFFTLVDKTGVEVQGLEQISVHTLLIGLMIADVGAIGYAISEGLVLFGLNEADIKKIRESASEGEVGISVGMDENGNIVASSETMTEKSDKEILEEDKDIDSGVEIEAGKGAVWVNTYPEPYRSAAKDSKIDLSTCYNREAQPAGTLITMADGSYRAVEEIEVGDKLWNHDGTQIVTVKSLWQEQRPVYNIRTGLGDIRFTGEHPLYTSVNRWQKPARGNLKAFDKPKFVKVKNLKVGDKVLVPELEGKGLGLTENELLWLGYYLGDGTKSEKPPKCPSYRLCVPDGRKREFVDGLNIQGSYSKRSNSEKCKFLTLSKKAHPQLRKVLDRIDGKDFSELVTPSEAEYIVRGYLEADGHHLYGNVYSASSTSKKLLLAIQRMVVSIDGIMSIHKRYDDGELEKFGTIVHAKALWDANINLNPKRSAIHQIYGGKYVTVMDISLGEVEVVYNIEVSGSHTYIADNHGVHNCVSYCAWKIKEATGAWPKRTGDMNAKNWIYRLPSWGYKKVSVPQNGGLYVGVLTSGKYGHVVWFEGDRTISEYNYASTGNYGVRQITLSQYQWYQIKAPATSNTDSGSKKSNDEIANEVIKGLWGNGDDRKNRLTSVGYDYNVIQGLVNSKLSGGSSNDSSSNAPKIGDKVKTSATKDQSGKKLNLSVINDGQSVWKSTNSNGYAVLVKGSTVRCAVPASSLIKA